MWPQEPGAQVTAGGLITGTIAQACYSFRFPEQQQGPSLTHPRQGHQGSAFQEATFSHLHLLHTYSPHSHGPNASCVALSGSPGTPAGVSLLPTLSLLTREINLCPSEEEKLNSKGKAEMQAGRIHFLQVSYLPTARVLRQSRHRGPHRAIQPTLCLLLPWQFQDGVRFSFKARFEMANHFGSHSTDSLTGMRHP